MSFELIMIPAPPSSSPHAREGLSLADPLHLTAAPSSVRPRTPREPPRLVKHVQMSLPEPQTLVKHDRSSLPEPESLIYSSNPAQIQLRSIRSPHEIQTQLKSIRAHFMSTQSRAICSHNLPRLSRSPLIRSHDGSAAAAAAHKSATVPWALAGVFGPGYLPLTSLCTSQVLIACEKRSKLTSELVSF